MLYLPDHKIIRIQLIARVYQQLCKGFENKIRGRDDKTIVALIYLTDFLFKFHQRAFSWDNLELFDELVHMHRSHDMRVLLHELVDQYSDRYLHRITNGMYAYRFRSYFACELEYLSRQSDEEMAAFNFTLDEAQMLRDHLEKQLEQGDSRDKTEVLNMLGELHELYQEYELARQYYRRCLHARDSMIGQNITEKVTQGGQEMTVLQAIISNVAAGRKAALMLQHWGPITLRLSLKIIMTYERERNYEEALVRYERNIQFCDCMIQAFAKGTPEKAKDYIRSPPPEPDLTNPIRSHVLEYLGIFFEPLFAYAWLLEKNAYTSGNSVHVLEKGIDNFENVLKGITFTEDNDKRHFLDWVRAQWYKKIGTLCFYKGLANKNNSTYVRKAWWYYLLEAEKLRDYFRRQIKLDYKKPVTNQPFLTVLMHNHYPAELNLSIAECLGELAESLLAEIEPKDLFSCSWIRTPNYQYEQIAKEWINKLDSYFFSPGAMPFYAVNLNSCEKFDLAINLSLAASFYLRRAGYFESAAREIIHTTEIVAHYLNWFRQVDKRHIKNKNSFFIIDAAVEKIIWANKFLPMLLQPVRPKIELESSYLMGDLIPNNALTALSQYRSA